MMLKELADFKVLTPETDKICWKHHNDEIFSINSTYKRDINDHRAPSFHETPFGRAWPLLKLDVSHGWWLGKLGSSTEERTAISSGCFLCKKSIETISHLFLHCKFTVQLWAIFLNLTETKWTTPEHTADLFTCWIRKGGSKEPDEMVEDNSIMYMVDSVEKEKW